MERSPSTALAWWEEVARGFITALLPSETDRPLGGKRPSSPDNNEVGGASRSLRLLVHSKSAASG